MNISIEQAKELILLKQGLIGGYRFAGKPGALEYVKQAGCIQFDPVDVCGKMAELTLQSRVKGFKKSMLDELLYTDRALFDYPDKQLSIIPTEDWMYFERYRAVAREGEKEFDELPALKEYALGYIRENGAVSADELPLDGKIRWHSHIHWSGNWSGTSNAARSVLEQLYSTGELVIHHKKGTRKYYDLTSRHIPPEITSASDPLEDDFEHQKWRILRRIGAIGLIWDRPSGFWNNVWKLTTENRHRIFETLLDEGVLEKVNIDGLKHTFYCLKSDLTLLEDASRKKPRCEFLAPLDPFLWDKQLIRELFGFSYSWEIYTPDEKRKFGAYTLPILFGNAFAGRIEALNDRAAETLVVKNIWYEQGFKRTKAFDAALAKTITRFAAFNNCNRILNGTI